MQGAITRNNSGVFTRGSGAYPNGKYMSAAVSIGVVGSPDPPSLLEYGIKRERKESRKTANALFVAEPGLRRRPGKPRQLLKGI